RIRMFSFSIVSLLVVSTTTSAHGFLFPFYVQDVLHFSPSVMGLLFLSAPVFTIGLAQVSGRLSDRVGPRIPTSIGVLATMGAFVAAMRAIYAGCLTLMGVAFVTSVLRGGTKIEPARLP